MADKDITINIWDKGRTDCYSTSPDHDTHGSKKWSLGYAFYPFASIPLAIPSPQIIQTPHKISVSGLEFSVWKRRKNLAKPPYWGLTDKGILVPSRLPLPARLDEAGCWNKQTRTPYTVSYWCNSYGQVAVRRCTVKLTVIRLQYLYFLYKEEEFS